MTTYELKWAFSDASRGSTRPRSAPNDIKLLRGAHSDYLVQVGGCEPSILVYHRVVIPALTEHGGADKGSFLAEAFHGREAIIYAPVREKCRHIKEAAAVHVTALGTDNLACSHLRFSCCNRHHTVVNNNPAKPRKFRLTEQSVWDALGTDCGGEVAKLLTSNFH